jgi:hypothetical protein
MNAILAIASGELVAFFVAAFIGYRDLPIPNLGRHFTCWTTSAAVAVITYRAMLP